MITRTFVAITEPRKTCVVASRLLSVAKTSVHLTPSLDTDTAKDFAGNSQERDRLSNFCCPPRSMVSVTGSFRSKALAWRSNANMTNENYMSGLVSSCAQNVLELPSTAMLAPCAPVSAELLAEIADFKATLVPAAKPFALKHFCPAPLKRNWPP